MSKKNILVSTTIGWNPGDEVIWEGVAALLAQAGLDVRDHNVFYWDRCPDNLHGLVKPMKAKLYGNAISTEDLDWLGPRLDLAIQAGSPEWYGDPTEAFRDVCLKYNIPYLGLGLGYGLEKYPALDDKTKELFTRNNTFITTREAELARHLTNEIGKPVIALACPGAFSAHSGDRHAWAKGIVQAVQSPIGTQSVHRNCVLGLDSNTPIITVHKEDWKAFKGAEFCSNYAALKRVLRKYDKLISTRLHVGLLGASMGQEVKLVSRSPRVSRAASLLKIPVFKTFKDARESSLGEGFRKITQVEIALARSCYKALLLDFFGWLDDPESNGK